MKIYLSEHQEQCMFFEELAIRYPEVRKVSFAVPNGGKRDKGVARKLKKEGVTAGVPDIFIDWPNKKYHGLRIELKRVRAAKPKTEPNQKIWIANLNKKGYYACVAYGAEEAIKIVKEYLNVKIY